MKKLTKVLLSGILASSSLVVVSLTTKVETVKAANDDLKLVYQLDFEDASNLGKNSIGNNYADATVYQSAGHMRQVDRDGGKAIMIDGQTTFENYLNLPTNFFENQTQATISGWFYLDSTAEAYSGEIGIFSPENDKAFRTDSHASFHGGHYIYVIGNHQWFDNSVYPIYDGWYHMAYVLNGAHIDIYQNGHLVGSRDCDQFTSVSQLHSATSHFYLGQSAYETNHPDYKGGFDDVRVYQKALTAEEIRSEYNFNMFDFMTNEYTFDSEATMYNDSVRGYNLDPHGADEKTFGAKAWPTYEDGAMKMPDNSMVVIARNEKHEQNGTPYRVNPSYLMGMSEITLSIDVKVSSEAGFNWERIFDVFKNGGQIASFMTHQGSVGSSFDMVYQNKEANNIRWVMGENGKQFNLIPENWYNITVTSGASSTNIYVDGVKIAGINDVKSIGDMAAYNFVSGEEPGLWFTLGAPIYEGDRATAATFDNFRVFSKVLTDAEAKVLAEDYSRTTSRITLVNGSEQTVVKHPTKQVYQLETLTKEGYTFKGWQDVAGNLYTEVPANKGDITLTAVFEELKYKVNFDANGGRGEMASLDITNEINNLPEAVFTKTGYTFAGWSTTADGSVEIQDNANIDVITQDTTLYAVWNAKQYAVSFNANGGEGTVAPITLTYDVEASLPEATLTRKGYTFAGWALTADGTVIYEDKATVTSISEGDDVELFAVWVLNTYKVLFDANGGSGSMNELTVDALVLTPLPANTFVRDGYIFKGWAIEEEVVYQDEEVVEIEGNVTLKAIWEQVQQEQPSDEPSEEPSEEPSNEPTVEPSETPSTDPVEPQEPTKKGCRGTSVGLIGLISLAGALMISKKRKNN